jgi:hypothetical protein
LALESFWASVSSFGKKKAEIKLPICGSLFVSHLETIRDFKAIFFVSLSGL